MDYIINSPHLALAQVAAYPTRFHSDLHRQVLAFQIKEISNKINTLKLEHRNFVCQQALALKKTRKKQTNKAIERKLLVSTLPAEIAVLTETLQLLQAQLTA